MIDIDRTSLNRSEQLIISLMLCLSLFTLRLLAQHELEPCDALQIVFLPFEEGFIPAVNVMCSKKAESCVQIYSSLVKAFKMIGFALRISGPALAAPAMAAQFPNFWSMQHDTSRHCRGERWPVMDELVFLALLSGKSCERCSFQTGLSGS